VCSALAQISGEISIRPLCHFRINISQKGYFKNGGYITKDMKKDLKKGLLDIKKEL